MSSDIWTQCAAESEVAPLAFTGWRSVEDQSDSSTYKLVDSPEEHEILEELLEDEKPGDTVVDGVTGLHYLLFTPFRYPPLKHGSRFGATHERGILYSSLTVETALAETAYYRYLFMEDSTAQLSPLNFKIVVFPVEVSTQLGLDLTASPFVLVSDALTHPSSYAATQPLGTQMRGAGIQAFTFPSARMVNGGINSGIFTPLAFSNPSVPDHLQTYWSGVINDRFAFFRSGKGHSVKRLAFERNQFMANNEFPTVT